MIMLTKKEAFKAILPRMLATAGVVAGLVFGTVLAIPDSGQGQAPSHYEQRKVEALEDMADSLKKMQKDQKDFHRDFGRAFDRYKRCQCR